MNLSFFKLPSTLRRKILKGDLVANKLKNQSLLTPPSSSLNILNANKKSVISIEDVVDISYD